MLMVVAAAPVVSVEVIPGPPAVQASNAPTSTVDLAGVGAGQAVNGFVSTLTPAQRLTGYPTAIDPA